MSVEERILAVKRAAEAQLFRIPGVHAVGIGEKFVRGYRTGETVIQVFVRRKKSPNDLSDAELVPPEIEGVKTDVIESEPASQAVIDEGWIRPLWGGIQLQPPPAYAGSSTKREFGSLGCMATNASGEAVALSNHHVLFANGAKLGSHILQPAESGCEALCSNVIGVVSAGEYSEQVDAAVVKLGLGIRWKAEIVGIGVVSSTCDPEKDMLVRKRGRTTRLTFGVVDSLNNTLNVFNHSTLSTDRFVDQIIIAPLAMFSESDFWLLDDFVARLRSGESPLSVYLWSHFVDGEKAVLSASKKRPWEMRSTLIRVLNRVLLSAELYAGDRFNGVELSGDSKELLARSPTGADLVRLNRLLLEDAYGEIKPVSLFPLGDSTDFLSFDSLLVKLGAHLGDVWSYLWSRLDDKQKDVLSEPDAADPAKLIHQRARQRNTLIKALNGILLGPSLFEPMKSADLSGETIDLAARQPVGADLVRLNRRILEDALYINDAKGGKQFMIAPRPAFDLGGDSGSVVVNDAGEIVALLFARAGGRGVATPIARVESALNIKIATADRAGVVHTVGDGGSQQKRMIMTGDSLLALSPHVIEKSGDPPVRSSISTAGTGFPGSAEKWHIHVDEIRCLVQSNRRVAAAWRRAEGAGAYLLFMQRLENGGAWEAGADEWGSSLRPFLAQLERYGSAALRADAADLSASLPQSTRYQYPNERGQ